MKGWHSRRLPDIYARIRPQSLRRSSCTEQAIFIEKDRFTMLITSAFIVTDVGRKKPCMMFLGVSVSVVGSSSIPTPEKAHPRSERQDLPKPRRRPILTSSPKSSGTLRRWRRSITLVMTVWTWKKQ